MITQSKQEKSIDLSVTIVYGHKFPYAVIHNFPSYPTKGVLNSTWTQASLTYSFHSFLPTCPSYLSASRSVNKQWEVGLSALEQLTSHIERRPTHCP